MLVTHYEKVASQSGLVLFKLDGNIGGENQLGKFDKIKDDIKQREAVLLPNGIIVIYLLRVAVSTGAVLIHSAGCRLSC